MDLQLLPVLEAAAMTDVESDRTRVVLELLPLFWERHVGLSPDEIIRSPSEDFGAWLVEQDSDELPLMFIATDLAEWFGIPWPELRDVLHRRLVEIQSPSAPRFTLGEFADWLAERANIPSFEPANLAGVDCGPAGAFFGLRDLAANVAPKVAAFAPSTPIFKRFRGDQLRQYWTYLAIHLPKDAPELHWPGERLAHVLSWKGWTGVLAGFALMFWRQSPHAVLHVLAGAFCVYLASKMMTMGNPLPPGIVTFGDLSRFIARSRES